MDQSLSEFPDHKYDIDYKSADGRISSCPSSNCVIVIVTVRWKENSESFILTRVFSK